MVLPSPHRSADYRGERQASDDGEDRFTDDVVKDPLDDVLSKRPRNRKPRRLYALVVRHAPDGTQIVMSRELNPTTDQEPLVPGSSPGGLTDDQVSARATVTRLTRAWPLHRGAPPQREAARWYIRMDSGTKITNITAVHRIV